MKLILHIGTHKTATTTIQRSLARSRGQLMKNEGVWYPAYSQVVPGMKDHYAHLDLAKGLMGESERFTPESVGEFMRSLYDQARSAQDIEIVLLSAEPFYRGRMPGDGSYWEHRREYVEHLAKITPFDEVEVVLVLRRQDEYLESLYNEHVKATRYGDDIWAFLEDYRSRFEYRRQIELWSDSFRTIRVCSFERLVQAANVAEMFLATVLGRPDVPLDESVVETNVSLPVDLVECKRLLNQTSLSRSQLRGITAALEAAALLRGKDSAGVRWLSPAERKSVLDDFAKDNAWLADKYAADGFTPFSTNVPDRPVFEGLDLNSFAGIVAEVISQGELLGAEGRSP